jgi:hypothetical protein
MVVADQWTGTDNDREDMKQLKLEQVLRVSYSPPQSIGPS